MTVTTDFSLDRGLPASPDAEKAILGACILDPGLIHEVMSGLRVQDLFLDSHRRILRAMEDLTAASKPIDTLMLMETLAAAKSLEVVGGFAYLSTLTDGVPRRASIEHYIRIIREKALLRELIDMASASVSNAMRPDAKSDECMSELECSLLALRGGVSEDVERKLSDRIISMVETIRAERASTREFLGYRFGIPALDDSLMGLRRKELVLIAAPPGRAKTALALQLAETTAQESLEYCKLEKDRTGESIIRDAVCMFSLEMSDDPLLRRLIAARSGVPAKLLRDTKKLTPDQLKIVESTAFDLVPLEPFFHLDDTGRLSITELISRARLKVRSRGCGLVIIDHIGLVQTAGRMDKNERLIKVTDDLRTFAKEENVCVVMLYHLAKPAERNPNKIPTMFDVRDATEVTDNSHIILLPFRELVTQELKGEPDVNPRAEIGDYSGRDMIYVGKHRSSEEGGVPVRFNKKSLQYEERH